MTFLHQISLLLKLFTFWMRPKNKNNNLNSSEKKCNQLDFMVFILDLLILVRQHIAIKLLINVYHLFIVKHYYLYIKHPTKTAILDQDEAYDTKFYVKFNRRVEDSINSLWRYLNWDWMITHKEYLHWLLRILKPPLAGIAQWIERGLRAKVSPVRFPVRIHAWVAGQVPPV